MLFVLVVVLVDVITMFVDTVYKESVVYRY